MAHRSGGGSHSGGHHSSHSSGRSGSGTKLARYSQKPFLNARRFRYYDKKGTEKYLYCDRIPKRMKIGELILHLVVYLPFFLMGYLVVATNLYIFMPPKPLEPVYETTDVHINDGIGVIEDENGLEDILQQFEETTGISPYVMTVYDSEWQGKYDELWEYAYYIYLNKFSDEQHFLIVYSEPENAEELEFVDWSWEGIQGDETDPILTETNVDRFEEDLHKNFLNNKISVGEAFEKAFEESLTYMMEYNYMADAVVTIIILLIMFLFILYFIIYNIKEYKIGKINYQEVPMEGSVNNTVPGAMGYGSNAASTAADDYYNDDARFRGPEYYDDDARYRGSTAYEAGKK